MKPTFASLAVCLLFISLGAQAAALTLHYCKELTADQFQKAATKAFHESGYNIWEADSRSIIGSGGTRKVQIVAVDPGEKIATLNPGEIRIQWVPGFGDKEKYLYKVAEAMLLALATESRPGEVTINWCKDLKTEEFRRTALEALSKRRYVIERDNTSSLIGAQKKYKVEITFQAPRQIVIRWVPGYGYKKDNWLDNLTRDITWILAL